MSIFIAIDFETADQHRDSACAVGLVRVHGNEIVRREVRLIRPPRDEVDPNCYRVHGISAARLRREQPFAAVWPTLAPIFEGAERIVAHNVAFDRSVLEACCEAAKIPAPKCPWTCTLKLAKARWKRPLSNRLTDVCERLGVPVGKHHEAGADAEMAARVLIAIEELKAELAADELERSRMLDELFARAGHRRVYGFDCLVPSCAEVTRGKVPPEFNRFSIEGESEWVSILRGDLADEVEPDVAPVQTLFSARA